MKFYLRQRGQNCMKVFPRMGPEIPEEIMSLSWAAELIERWARYRETWEVCWRLAEERSSIITFRRIWIWWSFHVIAVQSRFNRSLPMSTSDQIKSVTFFFPLFSVSLKKPAPEWGSWSSFRGIDVMTLIQLIPIWRELSSFLQKFPSIMLRNFLFSARWRCLPSDRFGTLSKSRHCTRPVRIRVNNRILKRIPDASPDCNREHQ